MPAITGDQIARKVFSLLNVFLPGESIPAADGQMVLDTTNDLLSSWGQRDLFIPVIARERFDLVANQGSETNPYTIGPGGDFDTERPSNQNSIQSANLILTASSPEVRVPLGIYTDQSYDANQVPSLTSTQPTGLYYNPTYDLDLGSIYLWPVPNISTNDIELFLQKSIAQFANLTTTYYVPDGVPLALKYEVADMLQEDYGKVLSDRANRVRIAALGVVTRSNTKLFDLVNDAAFTSDRKGIFNIQTFANG
jgi:hypothetical protein